MSGRRWIFQHAEKGVKASGVVQPLLDDGVGHDSLVERGLDVEAFEGGGIGVGRRAIGRPVAQQPIASRALVVVVQTQRVLHFFLGKAHFH